MGTFNADTNAVEVIEKLGDHVKGKTFVITGPSKAGIGSETAKALASAKPKQIILAGRNESRIIPVIDEVKRADPNVDVVYVHLDLLDNSSVQKAADEIKSRTSEIHGLINNAGIMAPKNFVKSKDGIESQFAACHIGHFLLTKLLLPKIAAEGTIVNVGSLGYQLAEVNLDDPNFQDGKTYYGWHGYGQAKTATLLFTAGLNKRLDKKGPVVFTVHPGVIMESALLPNSGVTEEYFMEAYALAIQRNDGNPLPPQTTKTLQQGSACILYALLDPSLRASSGAFLVENEKAIAKEYATSQENANRLWRLSEKLIGGEFNISL